MEETMSVWQGWRRRLLRIVNSLLWVIVALIVIPQACGSYWTDRARTKLLEQFQTERKSRVIAMIHRQETVSVLGVPVSNFIDIEDSEEILRAIRQVSDEMLVLIDMAAKARVQVAAFVADILLKHYPKDKAAQLAAILSEGRWTHDFPIMVDSARLLGLKVSTDMPRMVSDLMDLYPQAGVGRPSVLYVPLRRPNKDQGEPPKAAAPLPTSWIKQFSRRN